MRTRRSDRTLLVLRALGLGDLLTGVPALRALRRRFPDHHLVLAAPEPLRTLLPYIGAVDELLPCAGLQPLPVLRPDMAVDLHGNGPRSHRMLQATEPKTLVGFKSRAAGVDGPPWRPDEHEVTRWCRLVDEALGAKSDPRDLRLAWPGPSAFADAVVLHPGASTPARRWPADRFAQVAQALSARGHEVVVTGSPDEVPLVRQVVAAAGLPRTAALAGRTTLAELAAVVAGAALVVCGDTGMGHLATAYERPSVLLFGPVSPALWGPPESPRHRVIWHGTGGGDPHGSSIDPALARITVPEVVAAASTLLEQQERVDVPA